MTLETFLQEAVQDSKKYFTENSVDDVFVVIKKYEIGVKKPLLLYNENQKKVVSVHEVSPIARALDLNYDTFPQFFIYAMKTDQYKNEYIEIHKFLENVGKELAIKFRDKWMEFIDNNIKNYNTIKRERGEYHV